MNFLKRIFGKKNNPSKKKANTLTEQKKVSSKREFPEVPLKNRGENITNKLLKQLDHVDQNVELKFKKRSDAYYKLGTLNGKAYIAIPKLIQKLFDRDEKEVALAKKTLSKIDDNWSKNTFAIKAIPFLIKKLGKDQIIVNYTSDILITIGEPAFDLLSKELEELDCDDVYFASNLIKTIGAINRKKFVLEVYPSLKTRLEEKKNPHIVEAVVKAIADERVTNESISLFAVQLNLAKSDHLKLSIIDFLTNQDSELEDVVIALFKCLSDDNKDIRDKCIKILSESKSKVLDELFTNTIKSKGKISDEDLKGISEKVKIWANNDPELFKFSNRSNINNFIWHQLSLYSDLIKPINVLNSVLKIYYLKNIQIDDLQENIVDICETISKETTRSLCIKVLSNQKQAAKTLVPFMINYLDSNSSEVRKSCITGLNHLDPEWMNYPKCQNKINEIFQNFTKYRDKHSNSIIIDLGKQIVPLLDKKLQETKNHVVREKIIDMLVSLGVR